jgi:hypothetical protein
MRIEGDAGGGDGDYGESGKSGPDGMDLDLSFRNACGDGSNHDGGADGRMGQEADSRAVSEAEGDADGAGKAAAPAATFGLGHGRDSVLVGLDKKKKKKLIPRGGKQKRPSGHQRRAFFNAHNGDGK